MKIQHFYVAAIATVLLSGCGTLPPMNYSVPNVGVSQKKIDAEMKTMAVTIARSDQQAGQLDFKYVIPGPDGQALAEQMVPQLWR